MMQRLPSVDSQKNAGVRISMLFARAGVDRRGRIVERGMGGPAGVGFGGWIGYPVAGFIGACILIAIGRAVRPA
jgi:hypothetical protein